MLLSDIIDLYSYSVQNCSSSLFTALLRVLTIFLEIAFFNYADNNNDEDSYGFCAGQKHSSRFLFLFKLVHFIMSSFYEYDT